MNFSSWFFVWNIDIEQSWQFLCLWFLDVDFFFLFLKKILVWSKVYLTVFYRKAKCKNLGGTIKLLQSYFIKKLNLIQRKFLSIACFWSPSFSFKILMKICRRAIEINNREFLSWSYEFKFWRRSAGWFYHLKQKFNNKNLVIFFRANTKTTDWFQDVGISLDSTGY